MVFLRFSWRPVLSAAIVFTALMTGAPGLVDAQTLSISTMGIARRVALRTDPTGRFKVSRADCLADDVIGFPLIVGSYAGSTLEVWATQSTSDDCRTDTARTTATATCWRVYRNIPNVTTITVPIRVQDFAARPPPPATEGQDVGTAANCVGTTSTGQPVTLWFMFLQGTSQVGTAQSWSTTVDLLGPSPPVVAPMGPPGSGLLKMEWTANTDPDVLNYRFFCEDLGATDGITTYEAGTPGPEGGGGQVCADAGSGGTADDAGSIDDAGDAGGAGGAGGSTVNDAGCTPGSGGTGGGSGGTSGCGVVLVAGQILTLEQMEKYACGSPTGRASTSHLVTGLKNYNKYAVAMVASDLVENIGALSDVECGTPEPVNGFDEAYRSAGGLAGGASFCSLGSRSAAAREKLWPAAALLAGVALFRRRSEGAKRSRRSRSIAR